MIGINFGKSAEILPIRLGRLVPRALPEYDRKNKKIKKIWGGSNIVIIWAPFGRRGSRSHSFVGPL